MLFLALQTWIGIVTEVDAAFHVRGDADGVLTAVLAKRAKAPRVNLVVSEINLVLAVSQHELSAEHIYSEHNTVADALSRLSEGEPLPDVCRHAVEDDIVHRCTKFVGA